MSLIKCVECNNEVSDQAKCCIKCGYPINQEDNINSDKNTLWSAVTKTKTPINVFALAMMACASVLGASATQITNCYSHSAFTYAIHAFIAVSGMFFLAILFCRKGIYHPEELDKATPETLKEIGEDRPMIAAFLIAIMMFGYSLYQYNVEQPCVVESFQTSE